MDYSSLVGRDVGYGKTVVLCTCGCKKLTVENSLGETDTPRTMLLRATVEVELPQVGTEVVMDIISDPIISDVQMVEQIYHLFPQVIVKMNQIVIRTMLADALRDAVDTHNLKFAKAQTVPPPLIQQN